MSRRAALVERVAQRQPAARLGGPRLRARTRLHRPLVGFPSAGALHIVPFGRVEGEAHIPMGQIQCIGHRDVGGRERNRPQP